MPINYGLYSLSNSQAVPTRLSFPIQEYSKIIDIKNKFWEQGKDGRDVLKQQADQLVALPEDEALAKELYKGVQDTISKWDKAQNFEDLTQEVAAKAMDFRQQTQGMQAAYGQAMASYADLEKNAEKYKMTPSDIQRHWNAEVAAYGGQKKDPVTGRWVGAYKQLSPVEKPDIMKFVDAALQGKKVQYDAGEGLQMDRSGGVYYVAGGKKEYITAAEVQNIIAAAAQVDRGLKNWVDYQGTLTALEYSRVRPEMLPPEIRKQIEPMLEQGYTVAQAMGEAARQGTFSNLVGDAVRYGVPKYQHFSRENSISSVHKIGDGDGSGSTTKPFYGLPTVASIADGRIAGFKQGDKIQDHFGNVATEVADLTAQLKATKDPARAEQIREQLNVAEQKAARYQQGRAGFMREHFAEVLGEPLWKLVKPLIETGKIMELSDVQAKNLIDAIESKVPLTKLLPTDLDTKDTFGIPVGGSLGGGGANWQAERGAKERVADMKKNPKKALMAAMSGLVNRAENLYKNIKPEPVTRTGIISVEGNASVRPMFQALDGIFKNQRESLNMIDPVVPESGNRPVAKGLDLQEIINTSLNPDGSLSATVVFGDKEKKTSQTRVVVFPPGSSNAKTQYIEMLRQTRNNLARTNSAGFTEINQMYLSAIGGNSIGQLSNALPYEPVPIKYTGMGMDGAPQTQTFKGISARKATVGGKQVYQLLDEKGDVMPLKVLKFNDRGEPMIDAGGSYQYEEKRNFDSPNELDFYIQNIMEGQLKPRK